MIVVVLSLGMDTLLISISLGTVQGVKINRWRLGLTFASAEAVMPLLGLEIGQALGSLLGDWTSLAGGAALLIIGSWMARFKREEEDKQLSHKLAGWVLVATALSVSVDELAVGFTLGLVGVPIALTVVLIALQAFLFTVLGLTFGAKLKPHLEEGAERGAGIALVLLGLWVYLETLVHLLSIHL